MVYNAAQFIGKSFGVLKPVEVFNLPQKGSAVFTLPAGSRTPSIDFWLDKGEQGFWWSFKYSGKSYYVLHDRTAFSVAGIGAVDVIEAEKNKSSKGILDTIGEYFSSDSALDTALGLGVVLGGGFLTLKFIEIAKK